MIGVKQEAAVGTGGHNDERSTWDHQTKLPIQAIYINIKTIVPS